MKKELLVKFSFVFIGLIFLVMPISNVLGFEFEPDPDPDPDTTPPTIAITTPSSGSTTISGYYEFEVNANDDVGVTEVHYYIDTIHLGYTTNAPFDFNYNILNGDFYLRAGTYLLRAFAFDDAGNYAMDDISVQITNGREFYAVLVGINDYDAPLLIDLEYTDLDVTDWYNFLSGSAMDFDYISVLGDGVSSYPNPDDNATQENVVDYLEDMAGNADGNDVIVFTASGHGDELEYEGTNHSYFRCLDSNIEGAPDGGNLFDEILANILETTDAERIFVFLDICSAGGFGDDLMLMNNKEFAYCAAACSAKGSAQEYSTKLNGAWTYFFLEASWLLNYAGSPTQSMESVFNYAKSVYTGEGEGDCVAFDGDTSKAFKMA
ncbi:MAG: Ig-like domain-containing protein [Candidatus Heimdallarchaeota archaeon]